MVTAHMQRSCGDSIAAQGHVHRLQQLMPRVARGYPQAEPRSNVASEPYRLGLLVRI
jgi:hypothetical protein